MSFADSGVRVVREGWGEWEVYFYEAVDQGDPVEYDGTNGWVPADANNSLPMRFIAANDYDAGAYGSVFCAAVVDGFTGGTPGGLLYLSDTAGAYGSSAGTSSQVVGTMITDTVAFIQAQVPTT